MQISTCIACAHPRHSCALMSRHACTRANTHSLSLFASCSLISRAHAQSLNARSPIGIANQDPHSGGGAKMTNAAAAILAKRNSGQASGGTHRSPIVPQACLLCSVCKLTTPHAHMRMHTNRHSCILIPCTQRDAERSAVSPQCCTHTYTHTQARARTHAQILYTNHMIPHVTLRLFGSCLLCVAASPDFVFIASQVVSGELRFVKKIGEGAFGEVWEVSIMWCTVTHVSHALETLPCGADV